MENRQSLWMWSRRLGWSMAAVVALALLSITAWPLVVSLYGLAPSGVPWVRIAFGGVFLGAFIFALARARRRDEGVDEQEARTPLWLGWLIAAAWVVAVAGVVMMAALVWVFLGMPGINPPSHLSPRDLDALATRAFAVVAGLGGVAMLVISYRKQLTTERGEQREDTKLFNERFTAAYNNLGSDDAPVRLGAVYALAHLADDAPTHDLTQTVIDVLCAYIRMPYAPAPAALPEDADAAQREDHRRRELDFTAFREVRHTIIRIIGDRLRHETRWRGKDYDFTGAHFDGGDLHGAHFTGGTVSFRDAQFSSGKVSLWSIQVLGGHVDFRAAEFSGGEVGFGWATFSGGLVHFNDAKISGGHVDFRAAEFAGGHVDFGDAEFSGGHVDFWRANFSGANVRFGGASFSGGHVGFPRARFSGGHVDFRWAKLSGGHIRFGDPGAPEFDAWGSRPAGLLDAVRVGVPGVVTLSSAWQQAAGDTSKGRDATGGDP